MKLVHNYWMPTSDDHFERLINKRIKKGGPPEYQDDVRDEAYKYVTDFNIAVDVGANVGLWAKPLSKKFNRVFAYEPLEQVYTCLERNVNQSKVYINKFALGSTNNKVNMVYDHINTGGSYVSEVGTGSIDIKRMDDLNLPKFGLLKIDCERHELEVLKGAMDTILKYKPIIVCEQQADTDECAGLFLKSYGAREITNVRKDYIFGW
jgi:FkbM family methyltransferase